MYQHYGIWAIVFRLYSPFMAWHTKTDLQIKCKTIFSQIKTEKHRLLFANLLSAFCFY